MKRFLTILTLLIVPMVADAQSATQNNKFVWDQAATDLATANGYQYAYYETTTRITFTGVACTGTTSPFTCVVNIPAFTPGNHTIQITAAIAGSSPLAESAKSAPLTFTFQVVPATPASPRIQ